MKALNYKEVVRSYFRFSGYMIYLVATTLLCIGFFLKTLSIEISAIKARTGDSERIFNEQMVISDDFSAIFQTYRSLETAMTTNPEFFMNSIAAKKLEIGNRIQTLPSKDVLIHQYILSKMDNFLRTRDSIAMMKRTEDIVRADLIRCNEENKNVTRRLSVGRLSYDRK